MKVLTAVMSIFLLIALLTVSHAADKKMPPLDGKKFVLIRGGCFQMGNAFDKGNEDEKPVHEVCLADFYLAKYELTVGEFKKFADETGYKTEAEKGDGCFEWEGKRWEKSREISWRNTDFIQNDSHPVVCVSWNDATEYVKWLSGKGDIKYRLPTEAEWEYAARSGGKDYEFVWGFGSPTGNIADEEAKKSFKDWTVWEGYNDGFVYTAPVGTYKSNELGVFDLDGNVWEWTSDWYKKNYYQSSPKDNPQGAESGDSRVARGGTWLNKPNLLRTPHRFKFSPARRYVNGGFRLAVSSQ